MRKFAGREHHLCAKLLRKYGETPDLTSLGGSGDQVAITQAESAGLIAKVKYQRDFKPYALPNATESFLDLRSAKFNPLKALQAPKKLLKLPVTTACPLDNIQKCRHFVRRCATIPDILMDTLMYLFGCRVVARSRSKPPDSRG